MRKPWPRTVFRSLRAVAHPPGTLSDTGEGFPPRCGRLVTRRNTFVADRNLTDAESHVRCELALSTFVAEESGSAKPVLWCGVSIPLEPGQSGAVSSGAGRSTVNSLDSARKSRCG